MELIRIQEGALLFSLSKSESRKMLNKIRKYSARLVMRDVERDFDLHPDDRCKTITITENMFIPVDVFIAKVRLTYTFDREIGEITDANIGTIVQLLPSSEYHGFNTLGYIAPEFMTEISDAFKLPNIRNKQNTPTL